MQRPLALKLARLTKVAALPVRPVALAAPATPASHATQPALTTAPTSTSQPTPTWQQGLGHSKAIQNAGFWNWGRKGMLIGGALGAGLGALMPGRDGDGERGPISGAIRGALGGAVAGAGLGAVGGAAAKTFRPKADPAMAARLGQIAETRAGAAVNANQTQALNEHAASAEDLRYGTIKGHVQGHTDALYKAEEAFGNHTSPQGLRTLIQRSPEVSDRHIALARALASGTGLADVVSNGRLNERGAAAIADYAHRLALLNMSNGMAPHAAQEHALGALGFSNVLAQPGAEHHYETVIGQLTAQHANHVAAQAKAQAAAGMNNPQPSQWSVNHSVPVTTKADPAAAKAEPTQSATQTAGGPAERSPRTDPLATAEADAASRRSTFGPGTPSGINYGLQTVKPGSYRPLALKLASLTPVSTSNPVPKAPAKPALPKPTQPRQSSVPAPVAPVPGVVHLDPKTAPTGDALAGKPAEVAPASKDASAPVLSGSSKDMPQQDALPPATTPVVTVPMVKSEPEVPTTAEKGVAKTKRDVVLFQPIVIA